jgi:hypothetical protein
MTTLFEPFGRSHLPSFSRTGYPHPTDNCQYVCTLNDLALQAVCGKVAKTRSKLWRNYVCCALISAFIRAPYEARWSCALIEAAMRGMEQRGMAANLLKPGTLRDCCARICALGLLKKPRLHEYCRLFSSPSSSFSLLCAASRRRALRGAISSQLLSISHARFTRTIDMPNESQMRHIVANVHAPIRACMQLAAQRATRTDGRATQPHIARRCSIEKESELT